ncbi:M24 family metallopeptidase [Deinococcus rubellus]|uniref:M24 family metallopeptidase n=1 Tax=Deinococcus rubellus TaxID=1889240 RepID=UPI0031EC8266
MWRGIDTPRQLARLRTAMQAQGVAAVHLVRPENLAWLTGARSYVALSGERGVLEALITAQRCTLISSAIEAQRLEEEELGPGGLPVSAYRWWDAAQRQALIDAALEGQTALSDVPGLPPALEHLRLEMLPDQDEGLRQLGQDAGAAIARAARSLRPEMTEFEAAGILAREVGALGLAPLVNLCAGAARLQTRRHPLPTAARLGERALLVLSARRNGPVLSVSRLISFVPLSAQEKQRYRQLLEIEALGLDAAERGGPLSEIFEVMRGGYTQMGEPDEIERHHQGGLTGYRPREARAEPGQRQTVEDGMLVALNPSLPGWKVEDTFLRRGGQLHDLTLHDWPSLSVKGRERPAVMQSE